MANRIIPLAALLFTLSPAGAADTAAKTDSPARQSAQDTAISSALGALEYGTVEGPGVRFYCRVSGTSTAEGLVDVFAPFDGRVGELSAALFNWVDKDQVLGVVASVELSAMMDASSSKNTTRNRWKNMYDYYQVRAPVAGVIVGLYAKNKQDVYEQEKIFTIAKNIYVIAKTGERVYVPLKAGMLAQLKNEDGVTVTAVLRNFVEIGKTGQYQLRLEVTGEAWKIRPGMVFEGDLLLSDNPEAAMVPVESVIHKDGRSYLLSLIEVEPGSRNDWYTEVYNVFPGEVYITPASLLKIDNSQYRAAAEAKAGEGIHKPEITGAQPAAGKKLDGSDPAGKPDSGSKTGSRRKNRREKASAAKNSVVAGTANQPARQDQPTASASSIITSAAFRSAAYAKSSRTGKKRSKTKTSKKPAVKQAAPASPPAPGKQQAQPTGAVQSAVTIPHKLGPMPNPTYGDVGGEQGGYAPAGTGEEQSE
ncbi:MAG: hypothetical protein PHW69_01330 [Elusimicrobiaceae bacterium]|nr:hypothetical protein [Elusimicrobiaceae bacterium]